MDHSFTSRVSLPPLGPSRSCAAAMSWSSSICEGRANEERVAEGFLTPWALAPEKCIGSSSSSRGMREGRDQSSLTGAMPSNNAMDVWFADRAGLRCQITAAPRMTRNRSNGF